MIHARLHHTIVEQTILAEYLTQLVQIRLPMTMDGPGTNVIVVIRDVILRLIFKSKNHKYPNFNINSNFQMNWLLSY